MTWLSCFTVGFALLLPMLAFADSPAVRYEPYQLPADVRMRTDAYSFPVVPMTPAWDAIESKDRNAAIQVPQQVLHGMTTEGVVWTACRAQPRRHNWVFESLSRGNLGVRSLARQHASFTELFKRDDAGPFVLDLYRQMDPGTPDSTWSDCASAMYSKDLSLLELLLNQDEIRSGLTHAERVELLGLAWTRYNTRVRDKLTGVACSVLIGRLLLDLDFEPMRPHRDAISRYVDLAIFNGAQPGFDYETLSIILDNARLWSDREE
ncbi:MAG: hypothetical protein R3B81_01680 [bacterium]